MRRLYALAAAATLLAFGAVAASAQTDGAQEGGEPGTARAANLTIAIAGFENNLTPFSTTGQSDITENLLGMVYDTLFYSPWEPDPGPWLAEGFEVSDDKRTWTIDIREGVRWHDGRPLTAEDVAFTYDYFFENQQGRYSHHTNDRPFIERREAVDENTVRFTCREPCPTFDIDPGADLPILPKHVFEDVKEPAKFTERLPIGTGPYKLTEMVPDQRYVFEANDDYFRGRPLVDRIEMPIIPESSSMFLALRAGEVDAVSRVVPPQSVGTLERAGLTIVQPPDFSSVQINFNAQRPPFDRTEFRNALTLAVQTAPITKTLLGERGEPGVESFVDPDVPYAGEFTDKYDPNRAQQLLDGLGFADSDGDGVREDEEGEPLSFEILVSSDEAREIRAAEIVVDQLAKVGVGTEVVPLDSVTLSAQRKPPDADQGDVPDTRKTGDYDMYVTSYDGHAQVDPDALLYFFHCPGETGFGAYITGYCNERFDRLVDEAATLSLPERTPLLQQAQQVLYEDPPTMPLYFPAATLAVNADAFNGWKPEAGHGVVHKRSFLPGAREANLATTTAGSDGGSSASTVVPVAIAGLIVLGGAALLLRRRRRAAQAEPQGPEVD